MEGWEHRLLFLCFGFVFLCLFILPGRSQTTSSNAECVLPLYPFTPILGVRQYSNMFVPFSLWRIFWNVRSDDVGNTGYVEFAMEAEVGGSDPGWFSFGLAIRPNMRELDAWFGDTNGNLRDVFATGYAYPYIDASNDAPLVNWGLVGEWLIYEFDRAWDTGDLEQDRVINPFLSQTYEYAYSLTSTDAVHNVAHSFALTLGPPICPETGTFTSATTSTTSHELIESCGYPFTPFGGGDLGTLREYAKMADASTPSGTLGSHFFIYWNVREVLVEFAMEADVGSGDGYVSFGPNPFPGMNSIDLWWGDATGSLVDCNVTGMSIPSPEPANSLKMHQWSLNGDWLLFEFDRLLITGDIDDIDLDPSTPMWFGFAWHTSSNFDRHESTNRLELTLGTVAFDCVGCPPLFTPNGDSGTARKYSNREDLSRGGNPTEQMFFYWTVKNDSVSFAMEADVVGLPQGGYVAAGLDPGAGMTRLDCWWGDTNGQLTDTASNSLGIPRTDAMDLQPISFSMVGPWLLFEFDRQFTTGDNTEDDFDIDPFLAQHYGFAWHHEGIFAKHAFSNRRELTLSHCPPPPLPGGTGTNPSCTDPIYAFTPVFGTRKYVNHQQITFGGFGVTYLFWTARIDKVEFAFSSEVAGDTPGFFAFGLSDEPYVQEQHKFFTMGGLDVWWFDTEGNFHDMFCPAIPGPGDIPSADGLPRPDIEQNGTSDIIIVAWSNHEKWLTFEFERNYSTGDEVNDVNLTNLNPLIFGFAWNRTSNGLKDNITTNRHFAAHRYTVKEISIGPPTMDCPSPPTTTTTTTTSTTSISTTSTTRIVTSTTSTTTTSMLIPSTTFQRTSTISTGPLTGPIHSLESESGSCQAIDDPPTLLRSYEEFANYENPIIFKFGWTVHASTIEMGMVVSNSQIGWIGVGFGPELKMNQLDCSIAYFDQTLCQVSLFDYWSDGLFQPLRDSSNDLIMRRSLFSSRGLVVEFDRVLNAEDSRDHQADLFCSSFILSFAYSPRPPSTPDTFMIHDWSKTMEHLPLFNSSDCVSESSSMIKQVEDSSPEMFVWVIAFICIAVFLLFVVIIVFIVLYNKKQKKGGYEQTELI